MEKNPLISVIIPAYNCKDTIEKCIRSLHQLTFLNKEIIIIDDGSTDGTKDFLRQQKDIILIETKNQGPSRARNLGILVARGDYVAFTDSDCIVHPDWLNELYRGFEKTDAKIAAVGGDQLSPEDETSFGKKVQRFLKSFGFVADYVKSDRKLIKTVDHNPTCNVLYHKHVLIDAGFFNEELWPGEDCEIDYILKTRGYKFLYNPAAIVYHYRPETYGRFLKMMFHYGRAQGVIVRRIKPFRFLHYMALGISAFLLLILFMYLFTEAVSFSKNILIHSFALSIALIFLIASQKASKFAEVFDLSQMIFTSVSSWFLGFYHGIIFNEGLPANMRIPAEGLFDDPVLSNKDLFDYTNIDEKPFISLVLPNWNGKDDTLKCLDSISRLKYPKGKIEIIITDNGSTDGSQRAVKQRFLELYSDRFYALHLIENKNNEGAVKAYNQAYAISNPDADYIFKLDNDIELDPNCINRLLKVFHDNQRAGIAGGEIRSLFDRNEVVHSAGYCFFPLALFPSVSRYTRTKCGYVTGCAALIKKSVINQIGYFLDENYFVYHDDVDLCLNASKYGWDVVYDPDAVIYHKVGTSTGRKKRSAFAMYYDFRNKFYIVSKHASAFSILLFYLFLPLNFAYFYQRYKMFNPLIKAAADFFRGNMKRGSFK